jgi:hypothetical protein
MPAAWLLRKWPSQGRLQALTTAAWLLLGLCVVQSSPLLMTLACRSSEGHCVCAGSWQDVGCIEESSESPSGCISCITMSVAVLAPARAPCSRQACLTTGCWAGQHQSLAALGGRCAYLPGVPTLWAACCATPPVELAQQGWCPVVVHVVMLDCICNMRSRVFSTVVSQPMLSMCHHGSAAPWLWAQLLHGCGAAVRRVTGPDARRPHLGLTECQLS